ncbi:glycosyltransferase family protein 1 [Musa troglodytarum]|uniref:Glycosyltransferase family protein 1 n=1 Tax=Musa troglodytarum TaxID=320322 RepID=A0A9E7FRP1_9LILI|nr:glycosyltransferase family protein 1 [Musa troglodytarum]
MVSVGCRTAPLLLVAALILSHLLLWNPCLPPSRSPPPCFPSRMGSLEAAGGAPPKRSALLRPFPPSFACRSSLHCLSRFLLSEKVGYLQWVFTVAAFLIVVALFQAFLPGSTVERPGGGRGGGGGGGGGELGEIGDLDFGEGIRFVPVKLLERWETEDREANSSVSAFGERPLRRFGLRSPLLALVVVPVLLADAMQVQMVSIAVVLKEIGYDIQVFSFEDGPVHSVWQVIGISVNILLKTQETTIDWLNYNGILVNSLESRPLISRSSANTLINKISLFSTIDQICICLSGLKVPLVAPPSCLDLLILLPLSLFPASEFPAACSHSSRGQQHRERDKGTVEHAAYQGPLHSRGFVLAGDNHPSHKGHYRAGHLAAGKSTLIFQSGGAIRVYPCRWHVDLGYLQNRRTIFLNGAYKVHKENIKRSGIFMLAYSLLQEPFKNVPVIWTIHEMALHLSSSEYAANGQDKLLNDWKQIFSRATVVVFPTYLMPMMYSAFDAGNFLVIPGSPSEEWEAINSATQKVHNSKENMGHSPEELLIAIVSSQFLYSGKLIEHAIILEALMPLHQQFLHENTSSSLKIGILSANFTGAQRTALEAIARNVGFPSSIVENIVVPGDMNNFINIADIVIYGSFLEEQSFPSVLMQAMSLGKLIIAPDLDMISKYVVNEVNAYLFSKVKVGMLRKILLEVVSNGKLSLSAQQVAAVGKRHARNLMASETIQGYVSLLEKVLKFPSEIALPKHVKEIPSRLSEEWQWDLFLNLRNMNNLNRSFISYRMLNKLEEQLDHSSSANTSANFDKALSSVAWEEEKIIEMVNAKKRIEEEELRDRSDQPHGTWDEVYRSAKRADRERNELHERDDRELERTGQPLCIYEPYFGEGAWPFLHQTSLYRGIGLSSKGRRPGADDVDASSRLPLLSNSYYRDALGECGAFFALANRIDCVHKNAWIGFQSWRASARKVSLSKEAEAKLLEVIQTERHGDALYFWVRLDKDPRNPQQLEFWDFCDAINAGNCRFAVVEILQRMYGVQDDWDSLPQMPNDGDFWSVMHSWVLPTRSFLEFVMFSRMFVDALDAMVYDEQHTSGYCLLSISKDRQCYSRLLELLVNVWAYHSARRIVYVNPESGAMQEQHWLNKRRGQMWISWFSYTTLKGIDEDLAEEVDSDHPDRRWLWPSTGEIVWQGIYERERNMRQQQKERRKQHSRDKIQRIKKRARQKTLAKYIKPPPDEADHLNTTTIR